MAEGREIYQTLDEVGPVRRLRQAIRETIIQACETEGGLPWDSIRAALDTTLRSLRELTITAAAFSQLAPIDAPEAPAAPADVAP